MTKSKVIKEASSFRDSDALVFHHNGTVYRQINQSYQQQFKDLDNSGLYRKLIQDKLLLEFHKCKKPCITSDGFTIIKPEQLAFISYPYEWSFSQLKEAALTTLKIQQELLEHNFILKDASAFNIQKHQGKLKLIDTTSPDYYRNTAWYAYKQFCEHFLNPLVLTARYNENFVSELSLYIDGLPLTKTAKLLKPHHLVLNSGLFFHIYLHNLFSMSNNQRAKSFQSFSKTKLLNIISSLEQTISSLNLNQTSAWETYYQNTTYQKKEERQKENFIKKSLSTQKLTFKYVLDLGCNTGKYSQLSSQLVKQPIIAMDKDYISVNKMYLTHKQNKQIYPLVVDITKPSPAVGWQNIERSSLFQRIGTENLVLSLALIHHLFFQNYPLEQIIDMLTSISKYLIIEFPHQNDTRVKQLLHQRIVTINYPTLNKLKQLLSNKYIILDEKTLNQGTRTLIFLQRK